MSTETVRADWITDQIFLLRDRNSFPIIMTQPNGVNGADLLPLSLIGCIGWDILAIVQKQHQHVTKLAIIADSERDPEPPWRFRKIRIRYQFTGRDLKAQFIERAIALSETKYCGIYATLRDVVDIQSEFEIIPE